MLEPHWGCSFGSETMSIRNGLSMIRCPRYLYGSKRGYPLAKNASRGHTSHYFKGSLNVVSPASRLYQDFFFGFPLFRVVVPLLQRREIIIWRGMSPPAPNTSRGSTSRYLKGSFDVVSPVSRLCQYFSGFPVFVSLYRSSHGEN